MYTGGKESLLNCVIIITLIVGLIAGYFCGKAFMAPDPDEVARAVKYPILYEDKVLENHWNGTCTAVTAIIWFITILVSVAFYFKRLSLNMMDQMLRAQEEMLRRKVSQ